MAMLYMRLSNKQCQAPSESLGRCRTLCRSIQHMMRWIVHKQHQDMQVLLQWLQPSTSTVSYGPLHL